VNNPSRAEVSSVTPLNALSAVSLDTETTGLDVEKARLIQIGAIKLSKGKIVQDQTFEALVNPGVPIPPLSSEIHGLFDDDVKYAESFAEVGGRLHDWIGKAVVIGYSIGFDLAILKRENKLAQLQWLPPRTIDVRHLVKILSPQLPDYSLDTIASWLDVDTELRHQALGDAIITARVYQALVPRLMEREIRTLAELESACRLANNEAITESQAGWHDFLHSNRRDDISQQALARIDSYPYRHRVRDVMTTPPEIVNGSTTVSRALSLLMSKKISCVFVRSNEPDATHGIVTERDILRAIDANPTTVLSMPASELARFPLETIPDDAFIYRAMGRMSRRNFRHLGVVNKQGEIVGALSSRDLLKQRAEDALDLGDGIEHAQNEEDLSVVWANLALVASALDKEGVDARDIAAVISRELCALTRRACQIAEDEMGEPPVPYAMMVLGSGGRGESLLAMDQDNAIVYLEGETGSEVDKWFEKLGARVADLLHLSGVPYCKGGIMARNAEWRMSVLHWKQQIGKWISRTSPEDILKTDIFFDAVAVHGEYGLMDEITDHALKLGSGSREFLHLLSSNAADVNSPLGMFGRFRLDQGRIDVKLGGIMPIFSSARVEAIRHRITERTTPGRLRAVQLASDRPEQLFNNLIEAHRIILTAILKQQLYDLENGISLTNKVAPEAMNATAKSNLKWALEQVSSVTDLLGVPA
jgi:DNA polymerase-3 subunit epsilon/CBS domain-containing protein